MKTLKTITKKFFFRQKLSKVYLIKVKTEIFSNVNFSKNDYCRKPKP